MSFEIRRCKLQLRFLIKEGYSEIYGIHGITSEACEAVLNSRKIKREYGE